ncbi:MAG: type II secretion system protein [Candidatus Omnitrophica bacterium]|nr:type II secretion system protein [Candidatus Omnitrophota bacterium]
MCGRRAFTMIEVVIVLVISGIIATLGFMNYRNFTEKNRGKNAETNLSVIFNAEKRYKLSNNEYFACDGCAVSDLNKGLDIFIDDPYFTYTITADEDDFSAVAVRNSEGNGPCIGKTVSITDNSSTPQKNCLFWR